MRFRFCVRHDGSLLPAHGWQEIMVYLLLVHLDFDLLRCCIYNDRNRERRQPGTRPRSAYNKGVRSDLTHHILRFRRNWRLQRESTDLVTFSTTAPRDAHIGWHYQPRANGGLHNAEDGIWQRGYVATPEEPQPEYGSMALPNCVHHARLC